MAEPKTILKPDQMDPLHRLAMYLEAAMTPDRAYEDDSCMRLEDVDETANWCRMAGMQKFWNGYLANINKTPCKSLLNLHVFQGADRPTHRCNHQLCPSCWYATRMDNIAHFLTFAEESDNLYWYLRYTEPLELEDNPTPELLSAFKSNGGTFSLLGYDIQLGAEKLVPEGNGWACGELFHRHIGVFVAPKLPRLNWVKHTNGRYSSTRDVGDDRITTVYSDKQDVIATYAGMARPPGYVYQHDRLDEYVTRFAPRRSWPESTNPYGQMYKTASPSWVPRAPAVALESTISA